MMPMMRAHFAEVVCIFGWMQHGVEAMSMGRMGGVELVTMEMMMDFNKDL